MSAGGEHTNGIVGDDLSSSFERGCCLDGFTDVDTTPSGSGLSSAMEPQGVSTLRASIPSAWQPISTAPKGERYILLWGPGFPRPKIGFFSDWNMFWTTGAIDRMHDHIRMYPSPTHWMKLPSAPGMSPGTAETGTGSGPQDGQPGPKDAPDWDFIRNHQDRQGI